jgi:hypothetical protein
MSWILLTKTAETAQVFARTSLQTEARRQSIKLDDYAEDHEELRIAL